LNDLPIRWQNILPKDTLSGLQFFQLFRYGSVFLISIILPRAGLSGSDIGLFEAFLFFAALVTYFWVTGLIQALLPLANGTGTHPQPLPRSERGENRDPGLRRDDNSFPIPDSRFTIPDSRKFFNAALLLLLFSLLAGLALWLGSPMLGKWVGQELPRDLVGLVVLYIILFAPSTLVEYGYVISNETRKLVRYGIIAFTLQVLLVGIPVILGWGVRAAMWGMIAAGGFRTIWLIIMLIRNGDFHISFPFWKEYLALGGPVIMSVLLSGSAQYVNGFIISARFDASTFAVFRYGARELPVVALLAYALSNAMVPVMGREGMESGMKTLRERASRMAGWMFPLTAVLILAGYVIFPLVYGDRFLESAGVFNLYLLLITSRLLFPQTVLLALRKTRIQLTAALAELALNIGLSLILVNVWGIRGVALATVISYMVERIILMSYLKIKLGVAAGSYADLKRHLLWSAVLVILFVFSELVLFPAMAS
jgi:O-antigen/teichoic acid export membrane protein